MYCDLTLLTRTIIAEVACVGPFPSVGSHVCCEATLHTRTIRAEVACVGSFPSVGSHMRCEITLLTRMIRAEVARIPLRRLHLLLPRRPLPPPLRLAITTTAASPLPLHPACVLASFYSRSWAVRLACM